MKKEKGNCSIEYAVIAIAISTLIISLIGNGFSADVGRELLSFISMITSANDK